MAANCQLAQSCNKLARPNIEPKQGSMSESDINDNLRADKFDPIKAISEDEYLLNIWNRAKLLSSPEWSRISAQFRGLIAPKDKTETDQSINATRTKDLDANPIRSRSSAQTNSAANLKVPQLSPAIRFLLLATLISQQNAPLCLGFPDAQFADYLPLAGYNYNAHHDRSTLMPHHHRSQTRQLAAVESMQTLPTSPDSLIRDQQPESRPTAASFSGWTSMFGNSFANQERDSLDTHIENILVPRVSGTPGNVQVRNYIVNALKSNNYHVELDEFTGSTPVGKVGFANIIATSNPNSCRQLVLAAHYDSKLQDGFLGATDSAVPCAMLLRMAETFNRSFREDEQNSGADNKDPISLRFIFFDGEEAFKKWSPTDSLYGSRHLAAKWQRQQAPKKCSAKNELNLIELFVLLDLIGAKDTSFVMYNRQLRHHYNAMQRYERGHLAESGFTSAQIRDELAFVNRFVPLDFVEDDHVPFKPRGVPSLSLLAHPFPQVWHKNDDNYTAIDFPRTRRILHVLEEFVSHYQ